MQVKQRNNIFKIVMILLLPFTLPAQERGVGNSKVLLQEITGFYILQHIVSLTTANLNCQLLRFLFTTAKEKRYMVCCAGMIFFV